MASHGDYRVSDGIPWAYCALCEKWVETYEGPATGVPRYFPHMDFRDGWFCPSGKGVVASRVVPMKEV